MVVASNDFWDIYKYMDPISRLYIFEKQEKEKKMWFIHEPIESGHLRVIGTFVISKKRVDNRAQINYNTT